ncbi:hypothetical protein KHC33_01115 [Methanospirillum sp. J.3.6.1-F.2.7.3]|uniref:Uncharacterized protein n=1 Tax=Methanospirillum purgamenti TaxID=2834276 RepID=A0A8E7AWW5_9EURY|nr:MULTISPECIES: hypothetical protein [Methanospirillum]MDX8551999.1 hypothetical protein [Methanospirillum hungatei]QVV89167.1 hypothetical protein KHC33_01115 [Methanospirillum sp. J.3.6.1-F.2.7.3]
MADASPTRIEQVARAGREQVNWCVSSPELSGIQNLKRWMQVFAGDRCVAMEEV